LDLFARDQQKIEGLGRAAGSALRVHHLLRQRPLLTIPRAAATLELSRPTISTVFDNLASLGIVVEITGRQRDRLFTYNEYLAGC
jgi:Fic family protein